MTYSDIHPGQTVMHHGTPRIVTGKDILPTGRGVVWLQGVPGFVLVRELELIPTEAGA